MKKSEVVQLFAVIASLFPRDTAFKNASPDMVIAWAEMLEDIPFDHAKAAIKASVATSPFPPSIAEIRDYATRMTNPKRLTADEAWGIASEVIRNYGTQTRRIGATEVVVVRFGEPVKKRPSGLEYEAKFHCPPEVWEMLKRMGYPSVVNSDNPDVVRGQFMRAWDSHSKEAKEERVLTGIVPEVLQMITGQSWFQIGEGDGE